MTRKCLFACGDGGGVRMRKVKIKGKNREEFDDIETWKILEIFVQELFLGEGGYIN